MRPPASWHPWPGDGVEGWAWLPLASCGHLNRPYRFRRAVYERLTLTHGHLHAHSPQTTTITGQGYLALYNQAAPTIALDFHSWLLGQVCFSCHSTSPPLGLRFVP